MSLDFHCLEHQEWVLEVTIKRGESGRSKVVVSPCIHCLEEAKEQGVERGYDEGWNDMKEGEAK